MPNRPPRRCFSLGVWCASIACARRTARGSLSCISATAVEWCSGRSRMVQGGPGYGPGGALPSRLTCCSRDKQGVDSSGYSSGRPSPPHVNKSRPQNPCTWLPRNIATTQIAQRTSASPTWICSLLFLSSVPNLTASLHYLHPIPPYSYFKPNQTLILIYSFPKLLHLHPPLRQPKPGKGIVRSTRNPSSYSFSLLFFQF